MLGPSWCDKNTPSTQSVQRVELMFCGEFTDCRPSVFGNGTNTDVVLDEFKPFGSAHGFVVRLHVWRGDMFLCAMVAPCSVRAASTQVDVKCRSAGA
ncbi:MAG: hypothetical protein CL849_02075, partial [Crocinitomicaceae bacterium]|nr:hypothetical protein [Crocinitomicaceae bacterium]